MRPLRTLALTLLALPWMLAAAQTSPNPSQAVLPPVTAYALDRAKVTLPNAFTSPFNLLILYFQRDQEPVVNGWLPVTAPRVQTWRLPVSPRENGIYRWWMNASLRGGLAAYDQRRFTVPLYVDKQQFLRSLQVASEQDVAVLLTDRAGRVLWRSSGPVTDSKKAALIDFLAKAAH